MGKQTDKNSKTQKPNVPKIPVLSFRLTKFLKEMANTVPTYIKSAELDGFSLHLEGKLSGQPFSLDYPRGQILFGSDEEIKKDNHYMAVSLPLHSIKYYEKIRGDTGPSYAIDYTNREPEERDETRLRTLWHMHIHHPSGRVFLDSDEDLVKDDLEKLKEIGVLLRPITLSLYNFGLTTLCDIMRSKGKGTLDSLVTDK